MPLPLPNLDTRRWQDLVGEGRALAPRYDADWTDHNAHDPGITLMELFAWLAEMNIYRLNQIPPRHRLKFLELIGYVPKPPRASRTMLTCSPISGPSFSVPAGAQFETAASAGFRTLRDLNVSVAPLRAILVDDGSGLLRDFTGEWMEAIPIPCFGVGFYLGFDTLPAGAVLALGIRVDSCCDGEWRRILKEAELQQKICQASLLDGRCPGVPSPPLPAPKLTHHSAKLAWEAYTGTWTALTPASDDTRALTLDGIVELPIPAGLLPAVLGNVVKPLYYLRCRLVSGSYDRPPKLLGVAPNSVWAEQAVPAVTTFSIAAGVVASGAVPFPGSAVRFDAQIDFAGVVQALSFLPPGTPDHPDVTVLAYQPAAAMAPGSLTLSMSRAGYSLGTSNQIMYLPGAGDPSSVQQPSLALYTHFGGSWREWTRRSDLDASTRSDYHFVLDAGTGAVTFGDGEHGVVPPLGASVLAAYRLTIGDQGNIPAREVANVADSAWNVVLLPPPVQTSLTGIVSNRAASSGGRAHEDLDHAAGRAVEVLHAHERLVELAELYKSATLDQLSPALVRAIHAPSRAVNLLDIERLALNVPGACIARARAWAGIDANYECLRASGLVTVVILPDDDVPKPMPSAGLIAAVQRYLDLRRIVCTRIVVAPPQYLTVAVSAQVGLIQGASANRVQQSVRQALNTFLDPRIGGPNGYGWPFGRDVYRSEILQVIQDVPGVDHVISLSLQSDRGQPQCGNLPVCATWLVTPGNHGIEIV